nr:hypothetical protein CFP56_71600 [Quercus suber]
MDENTRGGVGRTSREFRLAETAEISHDGLDVLFSMHPSIQPSHESNILFHGRFAPDSTDCLTSGPLEGSRSCEERKERKARQSAL